MQKYCLCEFSHVICMELRFAFVREVLGCLICGHRALERSISIRHINSYLDLPWKVNSILTFNENRHRRLVISRSGKKRDSEFVVEMKAKFAKLSRITAPVQKLRSKFPYIVLSASSLFLKRVSLKCLKWYKRIEEVLRQGISRRSDSEFWNILISIPSRWMQLACLMTVTSGSEYCLFDFGKPTRNISCNQILIIRFRYCIQKR